jgi:putative transposase
VRLTQPGCGELMRKTQFTNSGYYHVFNRGVDKRDVFLSELDFQRFYESLYLFNDVNYRHVRGDDLTRWGKLSCFEINEMDRVPYVSVISFCLLPNHFHLLLKQEVDGGVSKFMQKVGQGYTNYFNKKLQRTGSLFAGPYKAVEILKDNHFEHLPRYIHLNTLDRADLKWRKGELGDWERAVKILDDYEWSSHSAYLGEEQTLPVVKMDEVKKMFATKEEYVNFLKEWAVGALNIYHPHLYLENDAA